MRLALDAGAQGTACRLAPRTRKSMLTARNEGTRILSVPEKLKAGKLWENLSAPALIEHAIARGEGVLGRTDSSSSIRARTPAARPRTSSSSASPRANDTSIGAKRISRSMPSASTPSGIVSPPTSPSVKRTASIVTSAPTSAIACRYASTPSSRGRVSSRAIFSLRRSGPKPDFVPEFTVVDAALFQADPARDGTATATFILVNFERRIILIGGTRYAGEIKKSVFTVMNYLFAAARHAADALLGERRRRRRRRDLLRTLRNRQDDALVRFAPTAHRRRRTRLVGRRRLQLRRRMLRKGDSPLADCRARDLGCDESLFDRSRKRRLRRSDARARRRLRRQNREHARRLSARVHSQRRAGEQGRPSEDDHHADGRRLRRAAADRQTLARSSDVPFPLRLHREGRRNRTRYQRAAGDVFDLLRRAVHGAPSDGLREASRRARSTSTTSSAGS